MKTIFNKKYRASVRPNSSTILFLTSLLYVAGCATGEQESPLGNYCAPCQDPIIEHCTPPAAGADTGPVCTDPTFTTPAGCTGDDCMPVLSEPDCSGNGSAYVCEPKLAADGSFERLEQNCATSADWTVATLASSFDEDLTRKTSAEIMTLIRQGVPSDPAERAKYLRYGPVVNYLGVGMQLIYVQNDDGDWFSADSGGTSTATNSGEAIVQNPTIFRELTAARAERLPIWKKLKAPHNAMCTPGAIKASCRLVTVDPAQRVASFTPVSTQCNPADPIPTPPAGTDGPGGGGASTAQVAPGAGVTRFLETNSWNVGGSNTAGIRSRSSTGATAAATASPLGMAGPSLTSNRNGSSNPNGSSNSALVPSTLNTANRNNLAGGGSGGGTSGSAGGGSGSGSGHGSDDSNGVASLGGNAGDADEGETTAAANNNAKENMQAVGGGSSRGNSKNNAGAGLSGLLGSLGLGGSGNGGSGDASGVGGASTTSFHKGGNDGKNSGASSGTALSNSMSDAEFQSMLEANSARTIFETVNRRYQRWSSEKAAEDAREKLAH